MFRCSNDWLIATESSYYKHFDYDGHDDVDKIIGVALNGVPIRQSLSEAGFDPLYPKAYNDHANPVSV